MTPVPPRRSLPGFPDARPVRPKTPFPGGLRRRWKGPDGTLYEWDYQHGAVEAYNARGRHLGQFDPDTAERQRAADPSRTIEP